MNSKPQCRMIVFGFYFLLLTQYGFADSDNLQNSDSQVSQLQNPALQNPDLQSIISIQKKLVTIDNHLDLLVSAMGKGLIPAPPIDEAAGITPLDIEALAWVMYEKINTLQYQILREHDHIDRTSYEQRVIDRKAEYDTANIIKLLSMSESIASKITARYNLPKVVSDDASCITTQSCKEASISDYYNALMVDVLIINRKINHLLLQPYNPSDVFRQIAKASSYWLLFMHQRFPLQISVPRANKFEPDKRSADVFHRLLRVNKSLNRISELEGEQPLILSFNAAFVDDNITSGDVYDLSYLILDRILNLTITLGGITTAADYPYPGVKFSSHVYQSVSRLENGVLRMEKLLSAPQKRVGSLSTRLSDILLQHSH